MGGEEISPKKQERYLSNHRFMKPQKRGKVPQAINQQANETDPSETCYQLLR
jgi:hypothetical protein